MLRDIIILGSCYGGVMEMLGRNEITNPIYSAADAVRAAGVPTSILQQWCNRGVVWFTQVQVGERTFRRFSLLDVLTIAVIQALRRLGVNPLDAREITSDVRAGMGQRILCASGNSLGLKGDRTDNRYLVVFEENRGYGTSLFFDGDSPIERMGRHGKATILIDLDAIASDVISELIGERRDDAEKRN